MSACPIGMATNSTLPQYYRRAATRGGGVLLGLLRVFLVASEVPGESNLCEDEGACLFVEVGMAGVGRVRDFFGVYEIRSCAVASLEGGLCLFRW